MIERWETRCKPDVLAVIAISATWLILVWAVDPIGDFPLNDDWIYGGTVRSILTGGGFRIPGPSVPDLLTQALWGAVFCLPFGFSYTALRLSTITLALLGLWFCYALARDNGSSPRLAFIATASIAVNPLYLALANSFMTDVPFMALLVAALFFLVRFLRDESWPALAAGLVIALLAILTRQIGVAILAAFAVANAIKYRFRIAPALLGALPAVAGVVIHLLWQRELMVSGRAPSVMFSGVSQFIPRDLVRLAAGSIHLTIDIAPYIGFVLVPVVAVIGALSGSPRRRIGFGAMCVVATILLWWSGGLLPSVGNVIGVTGLGPLTQRDTYILGVNLPQAGVWTTGFWIAATALGVIGAAALAAIGGRDAARRIPRLWRGGTERGDWLWIMAAVTGAGYWASVLLLVYRQGVCFDRYIVPLLPIALLLLLAGATEPDRRPGWTVCAGAVLVLTGGLSVAATADYLSWNRTRWAALNHLTRDLGIPPARIDGSWEFNGTMLFDPDYRASPGKSLWWVRRDDYMLASGPLPGYREVIHYDVPKLLPIGVRQVVVLERILEGEGR